MLAQQELAQCYGMLTGWLRWLLVCGDHCTSGSQPMQEGQLPQKAKREQHALLGVQPPWPKDAVRQSFCDMARTRVGKLPAVNGQESIDEFLRWPRYDYAPGTYLKLEVANHSLNVTDQIIQQCGSSRPSPYLSPDCCHILEVAHIWFCYLKQNSACPDVMSGASRSICVSRGVRQSKSGPPAMLRCRRRRMRRACRSFPPNP